MYVMRKTEFYFLLLVLTVVSALLILSIKLYGNSDILGESLLVLFSFIVLIMAAFGKRLFLFIAIVGFSLLAFASLMALFENDSYLFIIIGLGYACIVSRLITRISGKVVKEAEQEDEQIELPPETFIANQTRFEYPLLLRRIQALFIDSTLLLLIMVMIMIATEDSSNAIAIRVVLILLISNLYEPLLTAYSNTLGQQIMGIRVRKVNNPAERINLFESYKRFFIKGLLGWLSFITIHSNREHRAIHDFAGASVMIRLKPLESPLSIRQN